MTGRPLVTAPSVVPVLQVAIGDADVLQGQARYDTSRYDVGPDATYSGLEALFSDESCPVIEASTYAGHERTTEVFDIGTATVVVNNDDGAWDYPPPDGTSDVLVRRPGRQIRIGVVIDGAGPVWLWRGWIDATQPEYRPGVGDTVTVDAVDAKGEAGRSETGRVVTAVGAGETAAARMTRIADLIDWPTHRRLFDPTSVTLQATQFGGRAGGLFDLTAQSAAGATFGDTKGMLVYRARDWLNWPDETPPDVTIGNGPDDQVCPTAWEVSFARADFATRIVYGRAGEDPYTIDDTTNRARYGVETYTQTGLQTNVLQDLHTIGNRLARARSFNRAPRIAACTLDAAWPGHAAAMATLSPFTPTLVLGQLIEDDGRTVFRRYLYVTGVEHQISAEAWTCRVALDDAFPFMQESDARYDTARYNTDRYARAL